jgi:hypothetical protein
MLIFVAILFCLNIPLQRARENTCIDTTSDRRVPFLEVFKEDLLCHASALSSLSNNLKFKNHILNSITITIIFVYMNNIF